MINLLCQRDSIALNYKNCKLYGLQSWSSSPHLCYKTLVYVTHAFSSMFYQMADLCLPCAYRQAIALITLQHDSNMEPSHVCMYPNYIPRVQLFHFKIMYERISFNKGKFMVCYSLDSGKSVVLKYH